MEKVHCADSDVLYVTRPCKYLYRHTNLPLVRTSEIGLHTCTRRTIMIAFDFMRLLIESLAN